MPISGKVLDAHFCERKNIGQEDRLARSVRFVRQRKLKKRFFFQNLKALCKMSKIFVQVLGPKNGHMGTALYRFAFLCEGFWKKHEKTGYKQINYF